MKEFFYYIAGIATVLFLMFFANLNVTHEGFCEKQLENKYKLEVK